MKKHYFPSPEHLDKNHDNHCHDKKRYFSQFVVEETIEIPNSKPDVAQIVSTIVDPQIISLKVINTIKGVSAEGQQLTGKKVVAEIKIKQKILYVADEETQSVHVVEHESFQSAYVVVPPYIEGTDLNTLLKNKYIKTKVFVEDVITRELNNRTLFKNIYLFLELYLVPTYELCCSYEHNCHFSNLSILYQDGTNRKQLTFHKNHKALYPQWSPSGQEIAYLSDEEGSTMLYILSIKNLRKKRLTNPSLFTSISSYCWTTDGRKIIFTSQREGTKEIFCIDVSSLEWKQLTHGHSMVDNYNPKCSPCGSKIGFLKSLSGIADLYVMDGNGLNCRRVTSSGHVRYFNWSPDSEMITYIRSTQGKSDEVYITQINSPKEKILSFPDSVIEKRKVKFSPDQQYIALIGSNLHTDDIFIYNIQQGHVLNLTKNFHNVRISDLVWNMDSSKVYFSSNELFYENIYAVSIKEGCRQQLTNTTSSRILLSYRPRIK